MSQHVWVVKSVFVHMLNSNYKKSVFRIIDINEFFCQDDVYNLVSIVHYIKWSHGD